MKIWLKKVTKGRFHREVGRPFVVFYLLNRKCFFQIYFIQNVFRRVDYSTKFLWNPLKIKGFQTPDQKFDGK